MLVLNSLWWTIVGHPVQSLVGCCLCGVMFGIGVDHPLFSSILFAAEEWGLTLGSTECFKGILIFNLEVKLCCWCCWGYGAFLTWFLLYKNYCTKILWLFQFNRIKCLLTILQFLRTWFLIFGNLKWKCSEVIWRSPFLIL